MNALDRRIMDAYTIARATKIELERATREASARLDEIRGTERGVMGLTPDHIKRTPEWKEARRLYDVAFQALRKFNADFNKRYADEIREDRRRG